MPTKLLFCAPECTARWSAGFRKRLAETKEGRGTDVFLRVRTSDELRLERLRLSSVRLLHELSQFHEEEDFIGRPCHVTLRPRPYTQTQCRPRQMRGVALSEMRLAVPPRQIILAQGSRRGGQSCDPGSLQREDQA